MGGGVTPITYFKLNTEQSDAPRGILKAVVTKYLFY